MKDFILFQDMSTAQKEQDFINEHLKIRTCFQTNNLSKLFEQCLEEVLPYLQIGLWSEAYDTIGSYAHCFTDSKVLKDLKINCCIVALYTLTFWNLSKTYVPFQNYKETLIGTTLNRSDKKNYDIMIKSLKNPTYLNDFVMKKFDSKEELQIGAFNKELSLRLVLNNQSSTDPETALANVCPVQLDLMLTKLKEKLSESTDDFPAFLEYLKEIQNAKLDLNYQKWIEERLLNNTKTMKSFVSFPDSFLRILDLIESTHDSKSSYQNLINAEENAWINENMHTLKKIRQDQIYTRTDSLRNTMAKLITQIASAFILDSSSLIKSNPIRDEFNRWVLFHYTKEHIFHNNAVFTYIKNSNLADVSVTVPSDFLPDGSFYFNEQITEWITTFWQYAQLPLKYQTYELTKAIPALVKADSNSANLALTLLYKTFFLSLLYQNGFSVQQCITKISDELYKDKKAITDYFSSPVTDSYGKNTFETNVWTLRSYDIDSIEKICRMLQNLYTSKPYYNIDISYSIEKFKQYRTLLMPTDNEYGPLLLTPPCTVSVQEIYNRALANEDVKILFLLKRDIALDYFSYVSSKQLTQLLPCNN